MVKDGLFKKKKFEIKVEEKPEGEGRGSEDLNLKEKKCKAEDAVKAEVKDVALEKKKMLKWKPKMKLKLSKRM